MPYQQTKLVIDEIMGFKSINSIKDFNAENLIDIAWAILADDKTDADILSNIFIELTQSLLKKPDEQIATLLRDELISTIKENYAQVINNLIAEVNSERDTANINLVKEFHLAQILDRSERARDMNATFNTIFN